MDRKIFFGLFLLAFLPYFASGYCTNYATVNSTSTAYYFMSGVADNTTAMSDWQTWKNWIYLTPRTNTSMAVWQSVTVGGVAGTTATPSWSMYANTSLIVFNGSDVVAITNYTHYWVNQTLGDWGLKFANANYNGSALNITFNRTFPKDFDNFVNASGADAIYSGSNVSNWITQNTPSGVGADKTFRLNTASLGAFYNGSSVIASYAFQDSACNTSACTGVNGTIKGILVTVFLIGILAFLAFFAYNGSFDTKLIVIVVVAIVFMLVAVAILGGLLDTLCLGT